MTNEKENRIKVAIPIDSGHRKGADETLWATKIGNNRAEIDNIPGYVNGVSLSDIVEYKSRGDDFIFDFVKVVEKSGIKTLRLLYEDSWLKNRTKLFVEVIFPKLKTLGCAYEASPESKLSVAGISIPKDVDLNQVMSILDKFKKDGFTFEVADNGVAQ